MCIEFSFQLTHHIAASRHLQTPSPPPAQELDKVVVANETSEAVVIEVKFVWGGWWGGKGGREEIAIVERSITGNCWLPRYLGNLPTKVPTKYPGT